MKPKPKVGDRLFAVKRECTYTSTLYCTVTKVGRKFFSIELDEDRHWFGTDKIELKSWEYSDSNWPIQVYELESDYRKEVERNALFTFIKRKFSVYDIPVDLTLEKLRQITTILEEE